MCRRGSSRGSRWAPRLRIRNAAGWRRYRGVRSLAGGFVEEERAGDGSIEALDRAGAGNGDASGCEREPLRCEASTFIADEDCRGLTQVCVASLQHPWCIGAYSGEEADAAVGEGSQFFITCRSDGHAEDAADTGSERLLIPRADGAGCGEDSSGAEGLGGADEGAEVAGVLKTCSDEEERRAVLQHRVDGV